MVSSSKSRTCSSLSDDILIEIFSHLPLNSAYKFKCLSKEWLSILSNPSFIRKWYQTNKKSLPWMLYRDNNYSPELHSKLMSGNENLFSLKFLINEKPIQEARLYLLGSSNGFLLYWSPSRNYHQGSRYYVCNTLTQTWVSLPSWPSQDSPLNDITGIFCDYSSSLASRYKVVHIPEFRTPTKKFNVDMFCSDLGVWETFQVCCDENVRWRRSKYGDVVILNGVLFWIVGWNRMLVYNLNQHKGSDGHRCSLIDFPDEDLDYINFDRRIGKSEGGVCYTKTRWNGRENIMSVWVLNELNWQILHRDTSISNILAEIRSRNQATAVEVLCFSPVDRNIILLSSKQSVWGFNIQSGSVEELRWGKKHVSNAAAISLPFGLNSMPTVILPSPWV